MFFRMIKKDLKESKGLNVIILFFMTLVTTLVAASSLLLFANTRGVKVSQERCKPYDGVVIYNQVLDKKEEQREQVENVIKEKHPNAEFSYFEGIQFMNTNIYYDGVDYNDVAQSFTFGWYYLMKQPRDYNLVYDMDNKPFYVENGHMAIPYSFASTTGLKVGDMFYITAPNGRKYGFEISHITRDPIHDQMKRFIISDQDYEFMSKECPEKAGFIGVMINDDFTMDDLNLLNSLISKEPDFGDYFRYALPDGHTTSNAALVSVLVTVFLSITAAFMFLVIFFTIRFTIRSVIRKEERELGIMKALGADSVSFRWLFAAKYIAFAVIGGFIGVFAGVFLGDKLIGKFYYNISYSLSVVDYVVAIIAALVIILLVVIFILLSMRRINKISVMDVLHGEARSERIKHSDRFQLNKRGKMPIPLFLALTDIFGNFKRYVLLLIAFTLGSSVVIMNIMIKDSVISTDFFYKFYDYKHVDAITNWSGSTYDELSGGSNSSTIFLKNFDNFMKEHDIDATLELVDSQNAQMIFGESAEIIKLNFGFDPEGMVIRDGGAYPKLKNEIIMDYYTATQHDLEIGDSVTIKYDKFTEDRLSTYETEEEFVITGFVDRMSKFNSRSVIMSKEFNDAQSQGFGVVGFTLNVPESEKDAERAKLFDAMPSQCMTVEDGVSTMLGMYKVLFEFMRNLMFVVVAGVLGFLVVMYQTIFMKDEESEIALLSSSGFDDKSTKGWQFRRMMILFVTGLVISIILAPTVGAKALASLFCAMLGITGFGFTRGLPITFVWVVFITVFISFVLVFVLRKIRNIEIWRIRNE